MSSKFTGHWRLCRTPSLKVSQKDLMMAMSKPEWQANVVDEAEEDFILFHFHIKSKDKKTGQIKNIHIMEKDVTIFLQGHIKRITDMIPMASSKINYKAKSLICNVPDGQKFKADNKGFGDGVVVPTYKQNDGEYGDIFTLNWRINVSAKGGLPLFRTKAVKGVLKVTHVIKLIDNKEYLHVDLSFQDSKGGAPVTSSKTYERVNFTKEDEEILKKSKYIGYRNRLDVKVPEF